MIHTVEIDLTTPGLEVFVTPGTATSDNTETIARTTTEFLHAFDMQVAVNANFFYPFREHTPWDYFPRSGDRVNAIGQAISNGQPYSPPQQDWFVLCVDGTQRAQILTRDRCPVETQQAVSGSAVLLQGGQPSPTHPNAADSDGLYSRTAVAVDRAGETLWLVAIDDKQPLYSEGVTLAELTTLLMELGADAALNLDGGGSTTLVAATSDGSVVLNSPIHAKVPMVERPVANHVGIRVRSRF